MAIISMMILPMPAWILDIGLAVSFALAILIFTVTLFIERPLDFSVFPTVLLASLMLRLSLNVSSTKLIIGQGHKGTSAAGEVIEGFAMFVMSGSIFLGLVVFCILLIVNFIVITKGATRMAEVGARFALDAMPGKQIAIDSDISAGAIDHKEARVRRDLEQQETTFFGSLDGASKFVKGDAIAGLLITLLNLLMGLAIGVSLHDMPLGTAFETYAILTVGDGLVSQIPAVIISIASALLLARGGLMGSTDSALFQQIGKYPGAMATVGLLMALFGLIPGLPLVPFIAGSTILGLGAWFSHRQQAKEPAIAAEPVSEAEAKVETLGDILDLDEILLEFSPDLISEVLHPVYGLDTRIANMRKHIAEKYGFIIPEIRLRDSELLKSNCYSIKIQGTEQARGQIHPGQVLVLLPKDEMEIPAGLDVKEPVYHVPARWISSEHHETVSLQGLTVVNSVEVLATHMLETVKNNFSLIFTFKSLQKLLDEFTRLSDTSRSDANQRFINEMVPEKIPLDLLLSVLRLLLDERVSIRNLTLIIEAISEVRDVCTTAESICDHARKRLRFQIAAEFAREDSTLPFIQLAPSWEQVFQASEQGAPQGAPSVGLPGSKIEALYTGIAETVGAANDRDPHIVLITSSIRRRFLKSILQARNFELPVLSYDEIPPKFQPSLVGVVEC